MNDQAATIDGLDETANMARDVHKWVYEMSMWANPTVLGTCVKAFSVAAALPVLLMFVLTWFEDGIGQALHVAGIVAVTVYGIMAVLLLLAYAIIGFLYGGRYCVIFTMDDKGVSHVQAPRQIKQSQVMGLLGTVIGAAAMNPTVAGAGILASAQQGMYTAFKDVRRIRVNRRRNVIYLRNVLRTNHVYADDAEFDAVLNHIIVRCPQARRR